MSKKQENQVEAVAQRVKCALSMHQALAFLFSNTGGKKRKSTKVNKNQMKLFSFFLLLRGEKNR